MNRKTLLITLLLGSMSLGAYAQDEETTNQHHGFYYKPAKVEIEDFFADLTSSKSQNNRILNPWFTTNLILPTLDDDGTIITTSNIYPSSNGTNDSFDPICRIWTENCQNTSSHKTTTNKAYLGTYKNKVTGQIMDYNFDKGYLEVTVPDAGALTYPMNSPATFSGTDGIALFHIRLGGGGSRINDTNTFATTGNEMEDNTLSYNGTRAYLSDCTGVRVGIKAPIGCKVIAYFTTPNMGSSTFNDATEDYSDKNTSQSASRTAVFDCGNVTTTDYVELTSGAATGSLAAIDYVAPKWPNGYCVKNVDIAVYGVSAGDKVGFAGIQTLHDGWTPVPFYTPSTTGIEAVSADVDANAPVEYFNIQGVKVAADNLTPGLYITRQGSKATKVLVK